MTDPTPLEEGRRRTPITDGMANAMVRYGAARQCPGCQFGIPKYPGRYPSNCPRCGDELQMPKEEKARQTESVEVPVVCTSRATRIQKIIESGTRSFENYLNDPDCSRAVSVAYAALAEHGGADGVRAFFEGPVNGLYYRIEEAADPVIVAAFDNTHAKVRMFSTVNPRRYLAIDPREDIVVEDHEATFEVPLSEGVLQTVADKAMGFLGARLAKLWKMYSTLKTAKAIWDEAQRTSGVKLPMTATLRIARGLDDEMQAAFAGVKEGWKPRPREEEPPLTEAVTMVSALGLGLAVVGGTPLLFRGIARAAKWLGYPAVHRAFAHAGQVAHAIEQNVIDFAIPAELSYAVYVAMWKRGWRISVALGRGSKHLEGNAPLPFENYLTDRDFQSTIETGMWRLLLLFFFVNGAMHILAAPLGILFASEAAATGVKGVEIGQGLQRAMAFAHAQGPRMARAALESVNPENVRMVDVGSSESLDSTRAAAVQLFVSEDDARAAAERLQLALVPSRRAVGESFLWALVQESTGYALGKGEAGRLEEYFGSPSYDTVVRGPESARARQRAIDANHQRVAGEFAEDKRASAKRQRKPGEGPTQVRGGFRIHVGANQTRKPNKDAEKSLQNKMNAKRGLRARITGAKKWHRSREGKQLHAVLANYNREDFDAALRAKILDVQERIVRYSAGQQRQPVSPRTVGMGESVVAEDLGTLRPRSSGGTNMATARGPQTLDNPQPDDHLEAILRRLIVTQNVDVLQDVEFDENTGSIYLFFDPVLMPDEVEEVLSAIRQERGNISVIASPDMSLPGEAVESDWWVMFLPGPNETAIPDPSLYARNPEDYGTKVQAVVMAPPNAPEAVAQEIDVQQMLNAAGS